MQKNYAYNPPVESIENVKKMHNGVNLLECAGDVPTLYGRNIARHLWSKEELMNCIMSPGKDMEFMEVPRSPMTPTRKALFRGSIFFGSIRLKVMGFLILTKSSVALAALFQCS